MMIRFVVAVAALLAPERALAQGRPETRTVVVVNRPAASRRCPCAGPWGEIGIGGGGMRERVSTKVGDGAIEGGGGAFDLTVGWALRPGLVVALTFAADRAKEPRLRVDDLDEIAPGGARSLLSLGAVLLWYPRPGGALHLRGGLVGSQLVVGDEGEGPASRGPGLLFGAGLETRVSSRWSAGILLRATLSRLGEPDEGHGVGSLSLLLTLTRS